jgi:rubrerythrin
MPDQIKELEDIAEVISIAIAREQSSIEFYSIAYDKAVSEAAKKIFAMFLEQENGHEANLRAQLHELRSEIAAERLKKDKTGKTQQLS